MASSRRAVIGVFYTVLAVYVIWLVALSGTFFQTPSGNAKNRQALETILAELHWGDSYDDVLATYYLNATNGLTLNASDPNVWSISTTLEITLANWELFLEFDDRRLNAAYVTSVWGWKAADMPEGWNRPP